MSAKICSLACGIAYLFLGIAGCVPAWVYRPPPRLRFYEMGMFGPWGFLFTWMPVNWTHDVMYILIGVVAIIAAATLPTAIACARGLFFLTFLLTVVGFLPLGADRLWGLIPLFSWNVMFHAVTCMLCYYYGFIYPLEFAAEPAGQPSV